MGQQCCYNTEGKFTRIKRQVGPPAAPAGSADYYYPRHFYLNHQFEDYFPYRACCIESTSLCEKYYNKRPTDNNGTTTECTSAAVDRGMFINFG